MAKRWKVLESSGSAPEASWSKTQVLLCLCIGHNRGELREWPCELWRGNTLCCPMLADQLVGGRVCAVIIRYDKEGFAARWQGVCRHVQCRQMGIHNIELVAIGPHDRCHPIGS